MKGKYDTSTKPFGFGMVWLDPGIGSRRRVMSARFIMNAKPDN